jgi:hypothetical protein
MAKKSNSQEGLKVVLNEIDNRYETIVQIKKYYETLRNKAVKDHNPIPELNGVIRDIVTGKIKLDQIHKQSSKSK